MEKKEKKEKKLWKIVLMILFLICFLFLSLLIRRMLIISSLENKLEIYQKNNNIYSKSSIRSSENSTDFEKYYKDGIEKNIATFKDKNVKIIQFIYKDEIKNYLEKENKKTVTVSPIKDNDMKSSLLRSYTNSENFLGLLLNSITSSISMDKIDGKECYVLSSSNNPNFLYGEQKSTVKVYIEKETGLTLRYEDSQNHQIITYEYSFGTVKEEDVKEPDATQYIVIEK